MVSLTTVSAALTLQRSEIAGNASERLRSLLEIRFQNSLTGVKKSTTSVKKSTTSVPIFVLHRGFKIGQQIKRRREV